MKESWHREDQMSVVAAIPTSQKSDKTWRTSLSSSFAYLVICLLYVAAAFMLNSLLRNSTKEWNSGLSMNENARKLQPINSSRSRSNFCWRGPTGSTLADLTDIVFKVVWPGRSFFSLSSFFAVSSALKSCHSPLCLLSKWLLRDFVLPPEIESNIWK